MILVYGHKYFNLNNYYSITKLMKNVILHKILHELNYTQDIIKMIAIIRKRITIQLESSSIFDVACW